MKIENLILTNYRNYSDLNISFSPTLNIIYGNNGSGKSNLIEAIYLLALTKSFRTSNDRNLIQRDCEKCSITGKINNLDDFNKYKVEIDHEGKKVFINSDKVAKMSDYVSQINVILFNPLDTKVITDSPNARRKMLNIEISQYNKEYLLLLNDYNKVLKNRNAYLKQMYMNGNSSKEYLDILTSKLISFGLKIFNIRDSYVKKINNNITKIYKNIFEYGEVIIKYSSIYANKDEKKLLEMYQKNYKREMEIGKTSIGVHHDDIDFLLDGHTIKDYGSVGQQKNAIISFKLAEILITKEEKGYYPILVLDDLFSELDNIKVNNIISMLNKEVQTFITTTSINNIDSKLLKESFIFKVNNAMIEKEN